MAQRAPASPASRDAPRSADATHLAGLGNRFVEILARKLSRQDFALEIALLVAAAMRAKAVAVLGWDARRDHLRLLGECGLSDDGRGALGNGGDCQWDIPVRGLQNRRISVIAAAHQNPFVPRALVAISPGGLSIASLPIYDEREPIGVLLLLVAGNRTFPDAQLQTLSQAMRVCARGLRDPGGAAARAGAAARDTANIAAAIAELAGDVPPEAAAAPVAGSLRPLDEPPPDARIAHLEEQITQLREQLEHAAVKLRGSTIASNTLARERDGLAQRVAELEGEREAAVTQLRAELDVLQERLLAVESERARYQRIADDRHTRAQQAIKALGGERDTLLERVQVAESKSMALDGALAAVKGERTRLSAQVENVTGQLRATQEALERAQARHGDERTAIESDREGWKAQAATLRSQLAQRTEELGVLDRELRTTVVARDGSATQLEAARAELERLTALSEDASRALSAAEAARASSAAETTALRRRFENERIEQETIEHQLRGELDAARGDIDRLSAEVSTVRSELEARAQSLASRDEQLTQLHREQARAQEAETAWSQTETAQRGEIATLTATVEQLTAARQQLLDERSTLRTAAVEARQQSTAADVAYAAAVAELQSEAALLRRQVDTLTGDRVALAGRWERAVEEGKTLARGLAETQRQAEDLTELLQQRDAAAETAAREREQLAAQVAALTGQLQAGQEAWQRGHTRARHEHAAVAADRDEWKEQASTARQALAQATDRIILLEGELRGAVVARDVNAANLQTASSEIDRLSAVNGELGHRIVQLETAQAAGVAENTSLRRTLDDERTTRATAEQTWQRTRATTQAEAERLAANAAALHAEVAEHTQALADRDQELTQLRNEIELLRQQSVDRGVLAHQANELGATVVDLEQQLAAVRADGARAERQRAAVAEQLEAARRRETELLTVAGREQAGLQETLQALTAERDRLQADAAAVRGAHTAQQLTITELQSSVQELQSSIQRLRAERARAQDEQHDTAGRLAATQRQLDEQTAALRQREADVATQRGERQRLAAQLDAVHHDVEAGRAALEATQARAAQDRAALETERDGWKGQLAAVQTENERLTHALAELRQTAVDLDAAHTAATSERAALLDRLETERTAAQQLRDDRTTLHTEVDRLATAATNLRTAVVERDELLATAQERETTLRHETSVLQQAMTALRTESETVAAQLEERTAYVQQLRDGQAALERQLALVVATHGEEEQALANGMQAAREQVAQLEAERQGLCASLAELRQQLSSTQTAQTARLTAAQAEAAELRQQIKSLSSGRTELTRRLERAEKAAAAQTARADGEHRRAETLDQQQQHLQQQLAAAHGERAAVGGDLAQLRAEISRLTTQAQDNAAERDRLHAEHSAMERQFAQLSASSDEQARGLSQQLDMARSAGARLEQDRTALQSTLVELEQRLHHAESTQAAARAQAESDADALREQLTTLRTARDVLGAQLAQAEQTAAAHGAQADTEGRRAAVLAEQNGQLQDALAAADQRQTALDGALKQARAEIEALRQQSEDRGMLAHEASELGARVVELEQQLAAIRGEAAHAERQRAALVEELDVVRRQQSETGAAAGREQAKLHATLERLTDDRRQLEEALAARAAEIESQGAAVAELQAAVTRADEVGQAATQRLAEAQRQTDDLAAQLRQRQTAIETANAERQRLAAQVATLSAHTRASQETLDSLNGRWALERAAIEAERESFTAQAAADRSELERLAGVQDAMALQAAQLDAGRATAIAESAALRRTLDELRATHQQAEEALRAQVAVHQSEVQRVSADVLALRGELAERDELLSLLWQEQDATRQTDSERQQTIATLRSQLAASSGQAEEGAAQCQQLRDERDAVERRLAVLEAAHGEEEHALAQGLQAARAEIAQLEHERADARAAWADARQRLAQAESAQADAQARMQAELAELRQHITGLSDARTALSHRAEQAEQVLRQQSEQLQTEGRRAQALAERCAEVEQSLTAAQSQRTTLDAERQRLTREIADLRQDSADRGALARQAGQLNRAVAALEEQLAEMHRQAAHAEQQRVALTAELDAVRQEQGRGRVEAEQQQNALQAMLQQLTAERGQLVAERTAQQHQLETQRITLAELQAALEQTQADRQHADEDGRDTAQRLADAHRRMEDLSDRLRQRDATIEVAAAERQRLDDAVRAADAKLAELGSECDVWRRRAESASGDRLTDPAAADDFVVRVAREPAAPPTDAPLVIERSAPLDELLDSTPEPADTVAPEPEAETQAVIQLAKEMVLLDASGRGDEAYHVLKSAGFEVTRGIPNDAAVDDLATRKISCVMLNLAAGPAAWRTLKMLRERTGTRGVPLLAYLMAPDAQKGFCFGRADFGVWPMDGERLTDRLTQLRPKLKRLLAVSHDIDGMGRLREPLTKAGISTSSVLDGKQALEFATMVAPEAALFHLSPSCAGAARAITALRAGESTRDLPMMVLLDKAPAREDTFYAITARELISKGRFMFADLPAEIARLLA